MRKHRTLSRYFRALLPLFIFAVSPLFYGCPSNDFPNKPDVPEDEQPSAEQLWVHSVFLKGAKGQATPYLWGGQMPEVAPSGLNIKDEGPVTYFDRHIRYIDHKEPLKSDRFSFVMSTSETKSGDVNFVDEDTNYGFGYSERLVVNKYNESQLVYVMISSVTPNSPAAKSGLKRGDLVQLINELPPTTIHDYREALNRNTIKLTVAYPEYKEVIISKGSYSDTPVIYHTIFDKISSKTGYLVYNGFKKGESGQFDDELKSVFREFTKEGVENVIVDFRYNGGGLLTSAQLLGSMLVDKSYLDEPFIYLEQKESYENSEKFMPYNFIRSHTKEDIENLNPGVNKVYIITMPGTASASELIIHGLKPYMNKSGMDDRLIQVGRKTFGKNLGGSTVEDKKHPWKINIITMRVHNCEKKSDYEMGITPNQEFQVDEEFHPKYIEIQTSDGGVGQARLFNVIGAFGDIYGDPMLNRAIRDIDPTVAPMQDRVRSRAVDGLGYKPMPQEINPDEMWLIDERIVVD